MVAPCEPKQLTQSLVRVPNSGSERPNEVTLLDLSRVSSAAAMVPPMKLPQNLFPSKMHTQHRSTCSPMDSDLLKPSTGINVASESQPTVGHGLMHQQPTVGHDLMHQQTATVGASSGPTIRATATPSVGERPRTSFQNGTFLSLQADNGNITASATTAALTPTGGRKRPQPVFHGEATHTATLTTPAGETRPAKVRKTTTVSPRQQPRRAPTRSRATKEQILKENYQLHLENESLRRGLEAFRNYYYQSLLTLQSMASQRSLLAPQVH